jgi:hypothetical protein
MNNVGRISGYSAAELAAYEKTIRNLGITTQVARTILIRFMQAQLDVTDATKIARAAQDLAVISGQNTAEAAETITEAIAAQRPILLKQFGILADLNDIYSKQAKLLNKNVDELTEFDRRQAFVNAILEQAARVTGAYEAAMEKAGKRLTSIPRHAEEAANAIGNVLLPVFKRGIDDVTAFFEAIEKGVEENKQAVKDIQAVLETFYDASEIYLKGLRTLIGYAVDEFKEMKSVVYDIPRDLIKAAGMLFHFYKGVQSKTTDWMEYWTQWYGRGRKKPTPDEDKTALRGISDATIKEKIWLLNLLRKYDKINEVEYLESLQRMLADTRYTEEQRVELRRIVLEQLLQMEKTYGDAEKALKQAEVDFIKQSDQDIEAGMEELNERLNIKLNEAAQARREAFQREHAITLEFYDSIASAVGHTFSEILTSGKSLTESLKDGWRSLMSSIVDILARLLTKIIANYLLEVTWHRWMEKQKTAITAEESAKRATMGGDSRFGVGLGLLGMVLPFFQGGGLVGGDGASQDAILAALHPGEYVLPRRIVDRIGASTLDQMRRTGDMSRDITFDFSGMNFSNVKREDANWITTQIENRVLEIVRDGVLTRKLEI